MHASTHRVHLGEREGEREGGREGGRGKGSAESSGSSRSPYDAQMKRQQIGSSSRRHIVLQMFPSFAPYCVERS